MLKICKMDLFKFGIIVLFCFAAICCEDDLPYRTFRCRNGTYIDSKFICDGEVDCVQDDDGFDENFGGCSDSHGIKCGPGQFKCAESNRYEERVCKDATDRCNTITDCYSTYDDLDVDENNCGDEIQVEDCTLGKGKYLCDDGLRCLNINNTCDRFCNCFDCSDEKIGCSNGDETSASSSQDCFKTPNGLFCSSGYDSTWQDEADKSSHRACFSTSSGIHCCSHYDSKCQECDRDDICGLQKCVRVQFASGIGCFCDENYVSVSDTDYKKCFPRYGAAKGKLLLFSSGFTIKGINLFTKENFALNTEGILEQNYKPRLITAAHHDVIFAVVKDSRKDISASIFRTSLATNKTEKIIKIPNVSNDNMLTSLAADWITNNVYYSTKKSLAVCTGDGKICKNLKSFEANPLLGTGVYSVNVAPRFGLMFWVSLVTADHTNKTSCTLWKSSMDGSDEKLLLTFKPDVLFIFEQKLMPMARLFDETVTFDVDPCGGMWTVDESAERIYWFDNNTEEIQSVNFYGEKMKTSPFQLQIFKDKYGVQFRNALSDITFTQKEQNPSSFRSIILSRSYYEYNPKLVHGTIFENEVFFVDSYMKKLVIWSWEKNSDTFGKRYPLLKKDHGRDIFNTPAVTSLFVYNPLLHRTQIANPCPASCKKLCLTRPSSSENTLSYTCTSDATIGGGLTPVISIGVVFSVILVMWL